MKEDRVASGILFLVGAVVAREGLMLPYMSGFSPGPGFFPLWLGVGMMLLSAGLFITTRRSNKPFIQSPVGFRKASLVAVSLFVYIFALGYLGLLLSLAIYLAFLLGWVEQKRWRMWAAVAALGSIGCYLVFVAWLRVPLPVSIFGI